MNFRKNIGLDYVILSIIILVIWSICYHKLSIDSWQIPVHYSGDTLFNFSTAKAFMDGDIYPILSKSVAHLGAPFTANWNDYPLTEELIFAFMGWLGRFVGLMVASNIMLLMAHILAGLSFFFVSKQLKIRRQLIGAGSLLYAFTPYIFLRSFGHLTLSYYWHIPLFLLVTWWSSQTINQSFKDKKYLFSMAIAFLTGLLNPYYSWIFAQLMTFILLKHFVNKKFNEAIKSFLIIVVLSLSFLLFNLDTLFFIYFNGVNSSAVIRNLAGLEIYGLTLPQLFYPSSNHILRLMSDFANGHYFSVSSIKGSGFTNYIGLTSLIGFCLLCFVSLLRGLQQKFSNITIEFWQLAWILFYSMIGGFNLLLGTLGLLTFRATERYSIIILTLSLFYLLKLLSKIENRFIIISISLVMISLGLLDQIPLHLSEASMIEQIVQDITSDKNFVLDLEKSLKPQAKIFQLPFADFPETPPIHKMQDYEHFRPYIFSHNLRFSYGSDKGRGDSEVLKTISHLPIEEMVHSLEKFGFDALYINKKGYLDHGIELIETMTRMNKAKITETSDLITFALTPDNFPNYPILITYKNGWSGDEGTHRWAKNNMAKIALINPNQDRKTYHIHFNLGTLNPGIINIMINKKNIENHKLTPSGLTSIDLDTELQSGINDITFESDIVPQYPNNKDNRKLSFNIRDLTIRE